MLQVEKRLFTLAFLEPILGSSSADPEIHSRFIAAKAPSTQDGDTETTVIDDMDVKRKGLTVFPRDAIGLFLYDYHIKGFLKEAGNTIKDSLGIKNLRNKLERYVFTRPRRIYLLRNGVPITGPDGMLERALRAMTVQGERIALVSSERVDTPCEIQFSAEILENKEKIGTEILESLLEYGRYKGLGQWRNGSYGTFEWRRGA